MSKHIFFKEFSVHDKRVRELIFVNWYFPSVRFFLFLGIDKSIVFHKSRRPTDEDKNENEIWKFIISLSIYHSSA